MRSLRDKGWYITNIVTFEAAFRGKADILALPVQSARALKGLFENLWCEEEYFSDAVTRSVTCPTEAVSEPLKPQRGLLLAQRLF